MAIFNSYEGIEYTKYSHNGIAKLGILPKELAWKIGKPPIPFLVSSRFLSSSVWQSPNKEHSFWSLLVWMLFALQLLRASRLCLWTSAADSPTTCPKNRRIKAAKRTKTSVPNNMLISGSPKNVIFWGKLGPLFMASLIMPHHDTGPEFPLHGWITDNDAFTNCGTQVTTAIPIAMRKIYPDVWHKNFWCRKV